MFKIGRGKMQFTLTILYFTTLLLTLVIAAEALPESGRVRRDVASQNSNIRVLQAPVPPTGTADGDLKIRVNTTTCLEDCISVENVRIPTVIKLDMAEGPLTSYKLMGYSRDCPSDVPDSRPSVVVYFGDDRIININSRKPICSFRLGKQPERKLNVSFVRSPPSTYNETVADTSYCPNLCASSLWDKYPVSVIIQDSESGVINADNFIKIFSAPDCTSEIHPKVKNGTDLANLTLEEPSRLVMSFNIMRK